MKKNFVVTTLVLVIALVLPFLLFGGGEKPEEIREVVETTDEGWSWQSAAEPYKGKVLYVFSHTHPSFDAAKPLLKEFEELTGIKVDMELLQRRAMNTREEMELAQKRGSYDVTHISSAKLNRYVRAGWATPLNDFINDPKLTSPDFNYDDFFPKLMDQNIVNGKIYGIPYHVEGTILYYRTDIFDKYGIKEPPQTIEQLEEIAAKIHTKEVPAFVTRAVKGQGINMYTFGPFLQMWGGKWFDSENKPAFNSPEVIAASEKYAELLQKYGPFGVANYTHYECTTDFAQGKVAMFFGAAAWGGSVFNDPEKSKIIGKWACTQVPAGPKGRIPSITNQAFMIPANIEDKEAAWLFIQWYTSKETFIARSCKEGGDGSVSRKSVYDVPCHQESYSFGNFGPTLRDVLEIGIECRPVQYPEWVEVGDRTGAALQEIIAGTVDAKEAWASAAEDVYKIMEEAGYYK